MSDGYRAISWNRQKRTYDLLILAFVLFYLGLFIGGGALAHPNATIETLLIRGFGTCALLMLHVILVIGPLCRLNPAFLPLLYNRRHLGGAMFFVALAHGGLSLFQFHALGDLNPLISLFISNTRYDSLTNFPFQPLGFLALTILFLMAATSHDFWLRQLTAPVWKRLHMLVYLAYGLTVAHVALGFLQGETDMTVTSLLIFGLAAVLGLHLIAGFREKDLDRARATDDGLVGVCDADEIQEGRAVIVTAFGERVAVFQHEGQFHALSNVCRHQNGPLGEGRIIDGCVTCPWHGYQYLPETGVSPPPFTESVPVFRVEVRDRKVFIGRGSGGARCEGGTDDRPADNSDFYIGYQPHAPHRTRRMIRLALSGLAAIVPLVALVIVFGQPRFADGFFDFGNVRQFRGVIAEQPAPLLMTIESGRRRDYALVGEGKHGAAELTRGLDGRNVLLSGTLIRRDGIEMIEVRGGSISAAGQLSGGSAPATLQVGNHRLAGEIVDSKCYLGVMNPGEGKTHRECASLCIRGGVPPLFVVRGPDGKRAHLWLTSESMSPLDDRILDFVAEPVIIDGTVERVGDRLWFLTRPTLIRRLGR